MRELLPGLLVVAAGRFGSDESPFQVTARTLSERAPLASVEIVTTSRALWRRLAELRLLWRPRSWWNVAVPAAGWVS